MGKDRKLFTFGGFDVVEASVKPIKAPCTPGGVVNTVDDNKLATCTGPGGKCYCWVDEKNFVIPEKIHMIPRQ